MNYENKNEQNMNEQNEPRREGGERGRGHRCPDCPYEEPRCGQCERKHGRRHGEGRDGFDGPEDRRRWGMENRSPEHREDREDGPREEGEPRAPHVPHSTLGKLALCGRLAEQRRGMRRGQMHILRILEENGSMSQRVLQELLHIQPGSMSEIAAKLEAAGLILRERSEEDKRRVTVSISEKGRETLSTHPSREQTTLEPLTEEEQKTLEALLDKLIERWGAEAQHPRRGPGHGPGGFGPERGGPHGPGRKGPRPPLNPKPELL